jgi:hypothetical protein
MSKIDLSRARTIEVVTITGKYQPMPSSWKNAAGMARGKKKALETHAQKVRKDWK